MELSELPKANSFKKTEGWILSYGPLHIPSQACKHTQQGNSDDHRLSADRTGKRKASNGNDRALSTDGQTGFS